MVSFTPPLGFQLKHPNLSMLGMKTTLDLSDSLLAEAKALAAR